MQDLGLRTEDLMGPRNKLGRFMVFGATATCGGVVLRVYTRFVVLAGSQKPTPKRGGEGPNPKKRRAHLQIICAGHGVDPKVGVCVCQTWGPEKGAVSFSEGATFFF